MKFEKTGFDGLWLISTAKYQDDRGYFKETYREQEFLSKGIGPFVQDNESYSKKGTLRGMHFQRAPYAQGKLVRVAAGKVLDVVVDVRPESATFGKHYKCILDVDKGNMLYVPAGFAHGFLTLEDAVFCYKCTDYYHKESEMGIRWNDPVLAIDWHLEGEPNVSPKDAILSGFEEVIQVLNSYQ